MAAQSNKSGGLLEMNCLIRGKLLGGQGGVVTGLAGVAKGHTLHFLSPGLAVLSDDLGLWTVIRSYSKGKK